MNETANAIDRNFTSPNVLDNNWESANIVDTTNEIARALHRIADALDAIAGGAVVRACSLPEGGTE